MNKGPSMLEFLIHDGIVPKFSDQLLRTFQVEAFTGWYHAENKGKLRSHLLDAYRAQDYTRVATLSMMLCFSDEGPAEKHHLVLVIGTDLDKVVEVCGQEELRGNISFPCPGNPSSEAEEASIRRKAEVSNELVCLGSPTMFMEEVMQTPNLVVRKI